MIGMHMSRIMVKLLFLFSICSLLNGCKDTPPTSTHQHDERGLYSANFDKYGDLLLIASVEKSAQLWRFNQDQKLHIWTHQAGIQSDLAYVAISGDGKTAVTADYVTFVVWDTISGKSKGFLRAPGQIIALQITHDGKYILAAYNNRQVQVLDLETGRSIWTAQHAAVIESIAISADGRFAVVGCDDFTTTLWDIHRNKRFQIWEDTAKIRFVAISKKNKYVLTSSPFRPVKIYDVLSGNLVQELKFYRGILGWFSRNIVNVSSVAFSDDDSLVLVGAPPRNAHIWNIRTGDLIQSYTIPKHKVWKPTSAIVYATAFSEDQKSIKVEASNGFGYTWPLEDQQAQHDNN